MEIQDCRSIIKKQNYDVIVVGGGIAGISAAVAASREGAKTLLIDKNVVLGGLATIGLISWYEPLCDGSGKKMIGGIAEELIQLSVKYGFDNLPDEWKNGNNDKETNNRYATYYSPTLFAMAIDKYLVDNNVDILLDVLVTFPVMEGGTCRGIVAEAKEGRVFYGARVVIDATGDAGVLYQAGVPTVEGENFLTYVAHFTSYEIAEKFVKDKNMCKFRKWISAGSNLHGKGHPDGMKLFKGVSSEEITEFVLTGRKMLFDKIASDDRNIRDITMLPSMPQFRKIRRLVGEYEFTGTELDVKFENAIGSAGDFRTTNKHYQIPYTCLYNKDFDNLLAAGRMISASGDGWEITRVIPVAALTGQAAGLAAAMSLSSGKVKDVDMPLMQQKLKDSGVLFV